MNDQPIDERNADLLRITKRLVWAVGILCVLALAACAPGFFLQPKAVPVLPVVLFIGALGAFAATQRRLRGLELDEARLMASSWLYVWLGPLVGAALAAVLYCAFIGELLQGSLFPSFKMGHEGRNDFVGFLLCEGADFRSYGKLLVWSFIAGFSEDFVTRALVAFTSQRNAKQSDEQQRESHDG